MVGRDVVAVVIDRGLPSFLGVDVICTRDQARLMNVFFAKRTFWPFIL